jgi:hypothetical protein
MGYEIYTSPIHGKILSKNGKPVIENYETSGKLSQRFGSSRLKVFENRFMIKLPETINSIEECDCEIVGQEQPSYAMGSNYNEEPRDNEVHMARADLYRTAKLAIMLHEMLKNVGEGQGLDGWVQRKLTRAADYIESVFDYLDYEMRYPEEMTEEDTQVMGAPAGSPTQQTQQTPGTPPKKPGMTQTPGMVKMGKIDTNGNVQGAPIMVPAAQVKSKQQAGFHVIGESASAGASSAGGVASSTGFGNGFLNGGPGAISRYGSKKKKRKVEAKGETGPKFTGYWKGTDKGPPGKKMVGGN